MCIRVRLANKGIIIRDKKKIMLSPAGAVKVGAANYDKLVTMWINKKFEPEHEKEESAVEITFEQLIDMQNAIAKLKEAI